MKGVSTVIATVLMLVITIALAAMAYGIISGWFTTATQGIEVADDFCNSTGAVLKIRNIGTVKVTAITCTQTAPTGDSCSFTGVNIEPGQVQEFVDPCSGTGGRSCVYRLTPNSGRTIEASVHCV